jgi:hypothetical protein
MVYLMVLSVSRYMASYCKVINGLERIWKNVISFQIGGSCRCTIQYCNMIINFVSVWMYLTF